MHPSDNFQLVLTGSTTASLFAEAVLAVLDKLWSELGPVEYKKRWVEHEFPTEQHQQLKALVTV